MRVIGLLSWYEEPAPWLAECVAGLARFCDHLIAVDGPYALFPGATRKPASGSEQADTIARAAAGAGIGCTIHVPRAPWWGNEVAKRDWMFRSAMTMAQPGVDWLLRVDADEVFTQVPPDTRSILAETDLDVAEVTLWERGDGQDSQFPLRVLFRALPGIRIQQAHYVVTAPGLDGGTRVLVGNDTVHRAEPALALWDVRLEHRTGQRSAMRRALKDQYYARLPEIEQVREL
ncbi:hypothetical protein [Streptomyces sp. Amel2xC10]|uniref:hypothetical protein n=1 Tax=Streptomyces sp. Amel2xC10 TaxID=1305826 RepID=UPI000A08F51F|nr:hypothetical protein [Streptomyces sp. Amel2xC10]SMF86107.1 hypothetical protein SAMN02745830_07122 [Streptomyces sp. Amel2xC10]